MLDIDILAFKADEGVSPLGGTSKPLLIAVFAAFGLMISACGSGSAGRSTAAAPDADLTTVGDQPDSSDAPAELDLDEVRGAVVANSAGTVTTSGRQRVMTALLGPETKPFLGGPQISVTIAFEAVDNDDAGQAEGAWLTTNSSNLGLYVSYFEFPSAGQWEVVVSSGSSEVARTKMIVAEESATPNIGDRAPATDTPTATTTAEIAAISTDREPDPGFYDLSIAEAVSNDRPTMIAFATPAFCQTALCGPTLEAVKGAGAGHDDIDIVHVEPFDLELATAGDLQPIQAMAEWGLQTEPWVFIIDAEGIITATFEGIIGQDELESALENL